MTSLVPQIILDAYDLASPVSIETLSDGLINDSFVLVYKEKKLFLQALNPHVFKDPEAIMQNMQKLLDHLKSKDIPSLKLIKNKHGKTYTEGEKKIYRLMEYHNAPNAREVGVRNRVIPVAEAFGRLHASLMDFPANQLKPTIEGFHHLDKYLTDFDAAVKNDKEARLVFIGPTIDDFSELRLEMMKLYIRAWQMPHRAIHADAKADNVLLSHPPMVVDYDTFMQAPLAYDHGDLIRTLCTTSAEDEIDIETVSVDPELLGLFIKHYFIVAEKFLLEVEKDFIISAGELVLYELGIRFLTDYLNGDVYFKTSDSEQNLRRARVQMALLKSLKSVGK